YGGSYGYGIYGYYPYSGVFDTAGSIFDLPGLELPRPLVIGLFLLLYIVIIGPVNFIVLRRLRRTELAWATVPALVILFAVGAYLLAYQSKGGQLVMVRANIYQTVPELHSANSTQMLGLFSPVRRTYRLQTAANSAVTQLRA